MDFFIYHVRVAYTLRMYRVFTICYDNYVVRLYEFFFYLITRVGAIVVFFRSSETKELRFAVDICAGLTYSIYAYYYIAFGSALAYVYACGLFNTRIKNTLVKQISSVFPKNHRILTVEWTSKYKILCRVLIWLIQKVVTINNERIIYERVPRARVVWFYRSQQQRDGED